MDKEEIERENKSVDVVKKDNRSYALVVAGVGVTMLVGSVVWYVQTGRPQGVWVYTMLGVVGIISILAIAYAWFLARQSTPHEPDYYSLFVTGLVWVPLGLLLDMLPLLAVGAIFIIVGYHNKYRWKRKELTKQQQKTKAKLAIGLGLMFLVGGLILFLASSAG